MILKDYWPLQSALGFGKETKMSYLCKTIDYDCAYAYALHLVQLRWTHCQIIVGEIRERWVALTIACVDLESF